MKLPITWLAELLEGGIDEQALINACQRWDLKPEADPVLTLSELLTFSGFNLEEIEGEGDARVLDLEVLANRPDCQGVLGLVREVAGILRKSLKLPPASLSEGDERAEQFASVEVQDAERCPRYTARIIRGVKVGPSPEWLQGRLTSMGLIPRNNIVDITNLVLFEMNQPLHAFDLNKLAGRKIVVRRARPGEAFKPLYGETPALTPETLVIADAERPVAIGGVIGGAGSEVSMETTDILLETAYFQPGNIRRTSRRLKVSTDSSYRFERGVDLDAVPLASARAAHLICEIAGGVVAKGLLDSNPHPRAPKEVTVRHARVQKILGIQVPLAESKSILTTLGCEVTRETAEALTLRIPSWRRGDLEREIDLIEEIARHNGYDKVPAQTRMSARIAPRSAAEQMTDALREHFTQLGYFECITDSLVDPSWSNPGLWTGEERLAIDPRSVMREDHSQLRNNVLLSLLAVFRHNQDKRTGILRLFETGKVYLPVAGGGHPDERQVFCLVDQCGFAHLSDALSRVGDALSLSGAHLKIQPLDGEAPPPFLAPGAACRWVRVGEPGAQEKALDHMGWIGALSPNLVKACGLNTTPAIAEFQLQALTPLATGPRRYCPLPTQPEIVRETALVVGERVGWGEIERFARGHKEPLRDPHEGPRFLSVFRGQQIGVGKKSIAFAVVYRAPNRSLTDEEVNLAHDRFVKELLGAFEASLRGFEEVLERNQGPS